MPPFLTPPWSFDVATLGVLAPAELELELELELPPQAAATAATATNAGNIKSFSSYSALPLLALRNHACAPNAGDLHHTWSV